jgi:hypothetical protein
VRDVATHDVQTCAADGDVHQAMSVIRGAGSAGCRSCNAGGWRAFWH